MQLERAALQVGGPLGGARVREMPRGARQAAGEEELRRAQLEKAALQVGGPCGGSQGRGARRKGSGSSRRATGVVQLF